MPLITPKMGLRVWDQLDDNYDHTQLADNWAKIDLHDHTPGKGEPLGAGAIADNSIGSDQLIDASVLSTHIDDDAITTVKVLDGAITEDKIDPAFVTALEALSSGTSTLYLKSSSTAVQNLTTSFVSMKQIDNVTDSSVTPTNGSVYAIFVVNVASKNTHSTGERRCEFEVRNAAGVVLGKSTAAPESGGTEGPPHSGASDSGTVYLGNVGPTRATAHVGVFTSDGTAVKLFVKTDSTTDTPRLERTDTYVLLYELTT